jgi:hypothetical protein
MQSGTWLLGQHDLEMLGRAASGCSGYILRCTGRDDLPTFVACTGADIDYPVARRRDAHVVFDHNHRILGCNESVKLSGQFFYVRRMQASRWLIENIKSSTTLGALQFGCELDPLGFASGKLRRGLPKPDVT